MSFLLRICILPGAGSTIGDERAYFSNYGKCVDIFAPGLNIRSIWNTGKAIL
jgi:subtilisin family serine protease